MTSVVKVAVEAALAAGKIQAEHVDKIQSISEKSGLRGDVVTEVDLLCEKEIINRIQNFFPEDAILAEESGETLGNLSKKWIIDPLDGSLNYSHGYPCYCVSIGVEHAGELVVGVVFNPNLDELFVAEKGQGATLNGKTIKVSATKTLEKSLLVTGFSPKIMGSEDDNLKHFCNFMKSCQAVRRPGSAAMDLCYTAMGRFDGFWEACLSSWDMAAGVLIVSEAGGQVTDFDGGPLSIYEGHIVTTNGRIHQQMVEILARS
ncbi:MAG: inositol monophosphatase [Nitrospina sp.]|jgi:myo-inositol-1(or 4)-monophosphatase|nr:inositol monophosphatase [Nitrospina sp.]MBT6601755.1 inositol monophosphatase [Nitrospina sp.]